MCECLDLFSEPTKAWFEQAFTAPTTVQRQAWPAIHSGRHVLVVAPTGSGKTLTAFLSAIDTLMQAGTSPDSDQVRNVDTTGNAGTARDSEQGKQQRKSEKTQRVRKSKHVHGVRVLYISPLKALGVDVARNLQAPLEGIAEKARELGLTMPDLRVAIRSGDTTPRERRQIASHPPDILVTTPESLYLLLTSKARRILSGVHTVILDEIHAVAGSKRGAHLAVSLERLDLITRTPAQRIGLSATVRPVEEAARFLGGDRPVTIIDPNERPKMDLRVVEPLRDMRDLSATGRSDRAADTGDAADYGDQRHQGKAASLSHPGNSGRPIGRISGVSQAMERLAVRPGTMQQGDPLHGARQSGGPGDSGHSSDTGGGDPSGSIWPAIERSVLDEVLAHHTTLVFVNSRGLAERLTARLNDLYAQREQGHERHKEYGPGTHYDAVVGASSELVQAHRPDEMIAMAHHGSVSKDRRRHIEDDLKHGRLRCVVATSSLELGIDMGSVDLVIQIAPPLSVSSGLQRVGRADHQVAGVSHALFYPLIRQQIIPTAVALESMRAGDIEPLTVLRNPLDILAQQTVAAASIADLNADAWYAAIRRSAPFASLPRDMFDAVLGMMTGAYNSEEFSAFRPPLMLNGETGMISARPGAQRLAVTSGGTIPDRGMYTVVLPEDDAGRGPRRVGELDEEMVYESRVGDVITLGTSTWQIQEITRDRVIVTPAPGRTARLPFWHGEGNGRDVGFGRAMGRFMHDMTAGLDSGAERANDADFVAGGRYKGDERSDATFLPVASDRLKNDGLNDNAISNLARILDEQRRATGAVPDDRTLVVERCQDEEGDWRIMLHSPYGRRVHEPWAMAISARIQQRYGYDGQAYASDDGIVIRLPQEDHDRGAFELFAFDPDELVHRVETEVGNSVLFAARFRECAARSLFLPRSDPGRRVPLWQQRLRSSQLLAAAKTKRNFPLLLETARECLNDVYDLPALHELMAGLGSGRVSIRDSGTETPSPFAQHLLFGFVGSVMYQSDVPQAERNASLLSMDPAVIERLLGGTDMTSILDDAVIEQVESELGGRSFWNALAPDDIVGRLTRYAKTHGPFTADEAMRDLGFDAASVVHELDVLCSRGELMKGRFTGSNVESDDVNSGVDAGAGASIAVNPDDSHFSRSSDVDQYLHRDVFRRIRSRSLAKARQAIKPVHTDVYQSFLMDRQGVGPVGGARYEGEEGLLRVIEQLEGIALPADVWESSVFPTRVRDYEPSMVDGLLGSGDVVWVGSGLSRASIPSSNQSAAKTRVGRSRVRGSSVANSLVIRSSVLKSSVSKPSVRQQGTITFHPAGSALLATDPAGSVVPDGSTHDGSADAGDVSDDDMRQTSAHGYVEAGSGDLSGCIMHILSSAGAYRADRLAMLSWQAWNVACEDAANDTDMNRTDANEPPITWVQTEFREALWSLVWQGLVTNSSFTPLRANAEISHARGRGTRSVRRTVRAMTRTTLRAQISVPADLGGLWSMISRPRVSPEQMAISRVDALLDRYGLVAPPLLEHDEVPGGFSALYPVLRRMEETGSLTRGMFVEGFGAAQFAGPDSVNALRHPEDHHSHSAVALDALDPANLVGGAIAWPQEHSPAATTKSSRSHSEEHDEVRSELHKPHGKLHSAHGKLHSAVKPSRRNGTFVVIASGVPVLYAAPGSHHLLAFSDDESLLRGSFAELAFMLRNRHEGSVSFSDVNGEILTAGGTHARLMHAAGFVATPQGMKLYA